MNEDDEDRASESCLKIKCQEWLKNMPQQRALLAGKFNKSFFNQLLKVISSSDWFK